MAFVPLDAPTSGFVPFEDMSALLESPKPASLFDRLKSGARSTVSAAQLAVAGNNPDKIAGIVAGEESRRPAESAAQAKMREEIRPLAKDAADAEGVGAVIPWAKLAAVRLSQLVTNPKEALGMIAENLPNSTPGLAGMIAGGVAGTAVAGPFGGLVGSVAGGTAGGYAIEQGSAMREQILKEAAARGVDPRDASALEPIIAEKYEEFLAASRLKGIGTAGTDAVLNRLTFGLAGMGEKALAYEARALAAGVKEGTLSAEAGAAGLAKLAERDLARNTLQAKALRGGGVVAAEMGGESLSEATGQKLAYGKVDPLDVVDEGLLAVGQGGVMATGRKTLSPIIGTEVGQATAAIADAARTISPKQKILDAGDVDAAVSNFKFELGDPADAEAILEPYRKTFVDQTLEQTAGQQALLEKAFENDPTFSADGNGQPTYNGAPLRVVAPQDLTGEDGSLSRDAYEAINALAKAQGNRLVVYADHENLSDGAVNANATPGVVFLSDKTSTDPGVVASHEVEHLATDGEAQANYIKVVQEELTDSALDLARQRHGDLSTSKLQDEIRSDLAGDAWSSPDFHGKVIDAIQAQLGEKAAESTATKFLESIGNLIARVRAVLTGSTFTTPDGKRLAEGYVKNLELVHSALAAAIADRFVREGLHPPGKQSNESMLLVNRALALQAAKADAEATPGFQRTAEQVVALNAKPVLAPAGSSPALISAIAAAQKAPFSRTAGERLNLEAVKAGLRMSPKVTDTEKLAAQSTKSPEFQRWFGDSKVVDRRGNPVVVYHGEYQDIVAPKGRFWATSSPNVADTYAEVRASSSEKYAPYTIPAHLRLVNPMIVDADGLEWDSIPFRGSKASTDEIADVAEKEGHDGVVFKNIFDDSGVDRYVGLANSYVAFQPNAVKSVFNSKPTNRASLSHSVKQSERQKIEAARAVHRGHFLNVGLSTKEVVGPGTFIHQTEVKKALAAIGVGVLKTATHGSNTEPTAVVQIDKPLTRKQLDALSATLKQQAIPQYSDGAGVMAGPMAKAWGDFDPKQFKMLNGKWLSEVLPTPAKANPAKKDPRTGVALTKAMRAASLDEWLYGDRTPFQVHTQAELGELLQEMSTSFAPARIEDTPENREFVARVMEHETRLALEQGGNGLGWYGRTLDAAFRIAALVHPEIASNPDARFAFSYALAVTSNGASISENTRNAFTVYKSYAKTGKMPQIGFGVRVNAMRIAFRVWNEGGAALGVAGFRGFMLSKQSVKDLKKVSASLHELVSDQVYGGTIIGPKIGGAFLQNLNGNHDAIAMDRWFMRTWGRITGNLVFNKDGEMFMRDQPGSGGERHYIRAAMQMALERLQKDHPSLTMSDLQAVLWYPEKDVYSMHGVNNETGKPTDYETETAAYAQTHGIDAAAIEQARRVQSDEPTGRRAIGEHERAGEPGQVPAGTAEQGRATGTGSGSGIDGEVARFSPKQEGSVDLVGVHFSSEARTSLSGSYFGTGMKGAEMTRVKSSADTRLHSRVYAYLNTGKGVSPERYVGGQAHTVALGNLYDADSDPRNLYTKDLSAFESAVLDAGFDGYFRRGDHQGVAVLLGSASQSVASESKPTAYRGDDLGVPPARVVSTAQSIAQDKSLPDGQMTGADWKKVLGERAPAALDDAAMYYKSDIGKLVRDSAPQEFGNDKWQGPEPTAAELARGAHAEAMDEASFSPKSPEFGNPFPDSKVQQVVYHGTTAEFSEFDPSARDLGIHFGTQGQANQILRERGNQFTQDKVYPAYLNLKNPLRTVDAGDWGNGHQVAVTLDKALKVDTFRNLSLRNIVKGKVGDGHRRVVLNEMAAKVQALGYDGIVYKNRTEGRGDSYIVFHPEQIRSVFNDQDTGAKFSPKTTGASARTYTPAQERLFQKVGRSVQVPTFGERIAAVRKDLGKKIIQGVVDQFAPLKDISARAYLLARHSKDAPGALEALLRHGKLTVRDGVYDGDQTGGFIDTVAAPLQGEMDDALWWVAAHRAEFLTKEDREHLFSKQDIVDGKTLAEGTLDFDYTLANGQTTRNRKLAYQDTAVKYDKFNKNAMDMAEQSGMIDPVGRKSWEKMMYVPFYRVGEEAGTFVGGNVSAKLVGQSPFKRLKGGADRLNSDLLENVIQNWFHLLDSASKNRAAKVALEAAAQMGVAIEGPKPTVVSMAASIGNKGSTVWFLDSGVQRHFVVDDPYVMTAITSLEYAGTKGPIMKALQTFKHVLTVSVTASPVFKVRNLIRDSLQAVATSNLSYNVAGNVIEGFKASDKSTQTYVSALAGGGLIRFGTMLEGNAGARARQLAKMGVKESRILDSESKLQAIYDKYIEPAVIAYNELGNRSEEINRSALYKQMIDKGMDHATAAHMARDLMDFSLAGSWTAIRFLTQTVPFMNARMQGIYKLGRGAKDNPARFAAVAAATALFSVALLAAYADDDDWKKREDWDRDNYWWFKVGGVAFRIPKPFEIGAIATLAERGIDLATDPEMTGSRFNSHVLKLLGDNLSMNPIPQAVKPWLDVYANKDSFTGRPIESMGMERLQPDYRFTSRTSMAARAASTAGQAVTSQVGINFLSPVQIDSVLRGYFSWIGSFAVGMSEIVARPLSGQPDAPAGSSPTERLFKLATGNFVTSLPVDQSRYVSHLYEQARVLEQAYGTYRSLQKQGKVDEAREFFAENKDQLVKYKSVEAVKRETARLNERLRLVERSAKTPDEKKALITAINQQKDRIARLIR